MAITVHSVPILEDNYVWIIQASGSSSALVLDPGDAEPVINYLRANDLQPVALLITHRDWDHITGILPFLDQYPVPVYGPTNDEIPGLTTALAAQTGFRPDDRFPPIQVIDVPGHTPGHIAFLLEDKLFCADALFTAGCGRVRNSAFRQAYDSLQRLAALSADTTIHCSHEYTIANLQFALAVEPHNLAAQQRLAAVEKQRTNNELTAKAELSLELATNPFLRCDQPSVIAAAEQYASRRLGDDGLAVFTVLRQWKDNF